MPAVFRLGFARPAKLTRRKFVTPPGVQSVRRRTRRTLVPLGSLTFPDGRSGMVTERARAR